MWSLTFESIPACIKLSHTHSTNHILKLSNHLMPPPLPPPPAAPAGPVPTHPHYLWPISGPQRSPNDEKTRFRFIIYAVNTALHYMLYLYLCFLHFLIRSGYHSSLLLQHTSNEIDTGTSARDLLLGWFRRH